MVVNEERSQEAIVAINKIVATSEPGIDWMSPDLVHKILAATEAGRIAVFVALMAAGTDPDHAEAIAERYTPLTAFHMGILVGAEIEAGRNFNQWMEEK